MEVKRTPHSNESFVFGLLSILFSPLMIGLCFGLYGVILAKRGKQKWSENPSEYYTQELLIAGRLLSIIGIVLSGLVIIICLLFGILLLIEKFNPELGHEIARYFYIIIGMLN